MKMWPLLLVFTCPLAWRPSPGPHVNSKRVTGVDTPAVRAVLLAVNALRAKGCYCPEGGWFEPAKPLRIDERLNAAAQRHAEDMQQRRFFSHTSLEGTSPGERAHRAGYPWIYIGENIAWGYPTPESVVEGWQRSAGHCANMMSPHFQHMGVGRAGTYWVQLLGAPKNP